MALSKKIALRFAIAASASAGYYITYNWGPFLSRTYEWRMNSGGLIGQLLGFGTESEGIMTEKPSISPNLQKLIDDVKKTAAIEPSHLKMINLVPVSQLLPGRTLGNASWGPAYAAIPDYLNVTSIDDLKVDKLSRLIKQYYGVDIGEEEQWLSKEGPLLQSFIMSDNAKKFIIARQLYSAECSPIATKVGVFFATVYTYFIFKDLLLKIAIRRQRSVKNIPNGKLVALSVVPLAMLYILWKFVNFQIDNVHHLECDARAISGGELTLQEVNKRSRLLKNAFINIKSSGFMDEFSAIYDFTNKDNPKSEDLEDAAIEYYTNLIKRHLALKDICKSSGDFFGLSHLQFSDEGSFKSFQMDYIPDASQSLNQILRVNFTPIALWFSCALREEIRYMIKPKQR